MSSFDLRNLDFNNSGSWPTPVKLFFCGIVLVLILFLAWYLSISDTQGRIESLQRVELQKLTEFETKQAKAVNLEPLKAQLAEMEIMLQQMLRQLPSKTEMPDLIVDVSQTALASGIENELFQPGPEAMREFYAEKPIALRMVGSYHQFGAFVSGVASLPRVVIMTMPDISLKPRQDAARGRQQQTAFGSGALVLEGTVKTYRYLDEDEVAAQSASTQPARRP
jgi:type IV pilus assembly protein PilO